MRETVRAIYRGYPLEGSKTAPLVSEYITRQRLHKIGYVFDVRYLSDFKMRSFMIISEELDKLQNEDMKKKK